MSNTVEVLAGEGGAIRVVVRSQGERDLSAVTTPDELRAQIDQAETAAAALEANPAGTEPLEQD